MLGIFCGKHAYLRRTSLGQNNLLSNISYGLKNLVNIDLWMAGQVSIDIKINIDELALEKVFGWASMAY